MNEDDKKQYLEFAKSLALEAGEVMLHYFLQTERTWKADATPLTIADTTINRMVIERISERYPEHSILGEEESALQDSSFTWVCDPIDGTMPYSHGVPVSVFSLALCEDGTPQVAVVYDPFMKRLFSGAVGLGSYCNDEKMQVNHGTLEKALIAADAFPSSNPVVAAGIDVVGELIKRKAKVVTFWGSVLPAALVAQGQFTAVLVNIPYPQDPVAIKVLIEEAGGKVTDLFGNDQRYDQPTKGFIASNGLIHDELVEIVKGASK
jgi:myo-inositol-1(or 4)-monophosphatase